MLLGAFPRSKLAHSRIPPSHIYGRIGTPLRKYVRCIFSDTFSNLSLPSKELVAHSTPTPPHLPSPSLPTIHRPLHTPTPPCISAIKVQNDKVNPKIEETTKKWGLEAGIFKAFTSKEGGGQQTAKGLLKRYGSAYLITSISFAIVSFAACYALVASGVDVKSVLAKIGLQVSDTSEKVGTAAIAYAAHKALSPVRFPPTVALTPVVAKWLGKDEAVEEEDEKK